MTPGVMRVKGMHSSCQFSDTTAQKTSDVEKVFRYAEQRGVSWLTGTEAGEYPLHGLVRDAAHKYRFTFHEFKGNFVCIRKANIITGTLKKGQQTVVPNDQVVGPGHDLNFVWSSFQFPTLGQVTVIGSHLATRGRQGTDDPQLNRNRGENRRLARAIGDFTVKQGTGARLVFYGGDQNDNDKFQDTFFGQPLTSIQDELQKWEPTHWAAIDVIASYDADRRVEGVSVNVLGDKELKLHSDHHALVASYNIKTLR